MSSNVYGGYSRNCNARYNTVTINGGKVKSNVYGGFGGNYDVGDATNNTVEISGGELIGDGKVYGGISDQGNATDNTVTISGGTVTVEKEVHGGHSRDGIAENNIVTISGGTVKNFVYGGWSRDSSATGNVVTISDGKVEDRVCGGWSSNAGNVTENIVTISGGEMSNDVFGGHSSTGDATGNTVNLVGFGGTLDGVVTDNQKTPSIGGTVYGGYSSGLVSGNTLNVYGTGTKAGNIASFDTMNFFAPASATESMLSATNAVNLGNSKVVLDKDPGYTLTLLHSNAEIDGSTAKFYLGTDVKGLGAVEWGASQAAGYVRASKTGFELLNANKDLVWGVQNVLYAGIFTDENGDVLPTSEQAIVNLADVLGADPSYAGTVYGAYDARDGHSGMGGTVEIGADVDAPNVVLVGGNGAAPTGNTLNVKGSGAKAKSIEKFNNINFSNAETGKTALSVTDADITGAKISLDAVPADDVTLLKSTNEMQTNGNETYYIKEFNVTNRLVGKATNQGDSVLVKQGRFEVNGNKTELAWKNKNAFLAGTHTDAWGNTVSATDSTVALAEVPTGINKIYGSYTEDGSPATGGTIDLKTNRDFSGIDLVGGYAYGGGPVGTNTLNVRAVGSKAHNVSDFSNINFYVPASAVNGDVMLECTDTENATSFERTTVKTAMESNSQLKKNEKIVLLKNAEAGIVTDANTKLDGKIEVGGWMEYDGTVALVDGNKELVLTLNKDMQQDKPTPEPPKPDRLTENSKTFAETRAAGISFLNNAADMVAGQGWLHAESAAEAEEQAVGASMNEVPHAQVGFALFAALAAASMRYETGSYVDSKGWGINVGASRILHQEDGKTLIAPFLEYGKASYDSYLDNGVHGNGANQYFGVGFLARKDLNTGLYYEGSIRLGQMKGDYEGLDKYDTKSMYYALHAGIGKIVPVNDKSSMDYYGKLFYTHQNGDSVDLQKQYGEMDFDAINSFRTRLGFRYNHNVSEDSTFYTGLAWDYEFGSEARASYRGLSTPTPSMKGSSGLLEIGWKRPISEKNPVAIDVNLTGYAGKQWGISANVGLNWSF